MFDYIDLRNGWSQVKELNKGGDFWNNLGSLNYIWPGPVVIWPTLEVLLYLILTIDNDGVVADEYSGDMLDATGEDDYDGYDDYQESYL